MPTNLPGAGQPTNSPPANPFPEAKYGPGPVPATWVNPFRIMAAVAELCQADPTAADRIIAWVNAELAKIRAGR